MPGIEPGFVMLEATKLHLTIVWSVVLVLVVVVVAAVVTACFVQWLARLTAIQEVPGSIPGYTLEFFQEV